MVFHDSLKARTTSNRITNLQTTTGIVQSHKQIAEAVIEFYTKLLGESNSTRGTTEHEVFRVGKTLTIEQGDKL